MLILRLQQKMSDFNMVNVDSQSQIGKSVDTTKLKMLALDLRDFTAFLPVIKQLQNTSNKILKDLNPMVAKREKKTISLPYNLLRKFQTLKANLVQSQQILEFQGRIYGCNVANRDFDKMHEQQFYRKTLKSYDEKRLWMKQYILNNQATVQRIEEEVKKNIDYESHKYTQFRKQLNIERLEHNYEGKLQLIDNNISLLHSNNRVREKIKLKLATIIEKRKNKKRQEQPQKAKQNAIQNSASKLIRVPSFSPLLFFSFTKKMLEAEFFTQQIAKLKRLNKTITYDNQQLKLAVDKIQQRMEFNTSETTIILQQLGKGSQLKEVQDLLKQHRVTRTDYSIYLREIQRYCHQIINIYGNYFQYALQNLSFPNQRKSKSAIKYYQTKTVSKQVQRYAHNSLIQSFQQYGQKHKDRIAKEKEEREIQRKKLAQKNKLILKELSNSNSKDSGELVIENNALHTDKILESQGFSQTKQIEKKITINLQNEAEQKAKKQNQVDAKQNKYEIQLEEEEFHQI